MAEVDFTTFTEVDPDYDLITLNADHIDFQDFAETNGGGRESHAAYKELASAITGDYYHEFKYKLSTVHGTPEDGTEDMIIYGLSNSYALDVLDILNLNGYAVVIPNWDGTDLHIKLRAGDVSGPWDSSVSFTVSGYTLGNWVYVTVMRDDDGGTNNKGKYTFVVCTDNYYSKGGTPVGGSVQEIDVPGTLGTQVDFTHMYGVATNTSLFEVVSFHGEIWNLDDAVSPSAVPIVCFID